MTNWPTGINHLPEKSLLLTTTSENKPRSWQPRRNITSLIDRKCFHRSFVSLTSGLNKINHSTAWNLNREGSKFSNTVKRSRPYFVLSCFNPLKNSWCWKVRTLRRLTRYYLATENRSQQQYWNDFYDSSGGLTWLKNNS